MQQNAALPITVSQITKAYGAFRALDRVDLHIKRGEFLTLLGPSGSGKTTLLMALAGFLRPDSGSIRFGEDEMILVPPHKRDVGMVFQSYALFPHMDVAGNVGFPLRLRNVRQTEILDRVNAALDTVQLSGYGDRRINQLSGGQKQRVALARAIVFNPRILLMDEPLSALDKKLREHMQIELRRLHDKLGMTTVYVTHDQREALTMSDRIAVIEKGRLMQLDNPRAIYERPSNRFVADFIGESTFLELEETPSGFKFGGKLLDQISPPEGSGRAIIVLRPEKLALAGEDVRDPDDMNHFEAQVMDLIYEGETSLISVSLSDGTRVSVRVGTRSGGAADRLCVGDYTVLTLHREDTLVIRDF